MNDRRAARDALLARSTAVGMALTVLTATATGAVTGWLARPEPAGAQVAPEPPVTVRLPQPRRTVYLRVVLRQEPAGRPLRTPPRRPAAPRPPAVAPAPTRAAPVARSDGS
jgi:hypothetical protein